MAATTEELLQMILQSLEKVEYIKSEDIPNIDLYKIIHVPHKIRNM